MAGIVIRAATRPTIHRSPVAPHRGGREGEGGCLMDVEMVAKNLQLIIAPVVMISSCALLLTGLLGRYAAVNDRLRAMARERLDLWHSDIDGDGFKTERLHQIDQQIPDLLRRHRM